MKLMTSAAALLLAAGLSAGPASAGDTTYSPFWVGTAYTYTLVDANGDPVTAPGKVDSVGNIDPSCTGCYYRLHDSSDPSGSTVHNVRGTLSTNSATGNSKFESADGAIYGNTSGAVTAIGSAGLITNGTVAAKTLATEDSAGHYYGNVGDVLTSHGAAISMLNGAVGVAQETADRALASAAIVAAMPQLHFGPGDWLSVGAGGAALSDGPGAGAIAVGALLTPSFMLAAKAGWSEHDAAVYAVHGSWSFGGSGGRSSYPLK